MPTDTAHLTPPVNHVFVDFENVHKIDHAIIGKKAVSFTLLVGPRQSIDGAVVEELFKHAASVQLVRLASAGKNALDFILAYYVGRAVVTDPTGYYHIVSRDTGFDPLIQHLLSKRISARRYDGFADLPFAAPVKPPAPRLPATVSKPKPQVKAKAKSASLDQQVTRVLDHWRKPTSTRPKNKKKLTSYLVAYLGQTISEAEALKIVEALHQAGSLDIDGKGRVTYHPQME